ncbi:MAG: hypothetical protein J7K15_03060 [Deltaproteobacteria bacterium]|jgi:hypothetical protein|nr:hypothetical protein [Deltaproteobacteria bacterium]
MKIDRINYNNRKRQFELCVGTQSFVFPYAKLDVQPTSGNRIAQVFIDKELANEAFTYRLQSGEEGTVHIDHVLEYNRDPKFMADLLLYKLTIEAQKRLKSSGLSNREIIRRLGTSASQYYRLLDQTYYGKSIHQMLCLLGLLNCQVDVVLKDKRPKSRRKVLVSV